MLLAQCQCGHEIGLSDEQIGQLLKCPECQSSVTALSSGNGGDICTTGVVVAQGPQRAGEIFLLSGDGTIEIGKLPGKPIQLVGMMVSRNHCQLRRESDGEWLLEDLKSTNGVFVNRQRVDVRTLKHGDLIQVGEYLLKFFNTMGATSAENDHDVQDLSQVEDEHIEELDEVEGLEEVEELEEVEPAALDDLGPPADDLYDVIEPEEPVRMHTAAAPAPQLPPKTCPSCQQSYPGNAKICVGCGINLDTGRPLMISKGIDENDLAVRADTWIRIVSWVIRIGIFPVASEAFGTKKPRATWAITGLTVVASVVFYIALIGAKASDEPSPSLQNLMLVSGSREVTRNEVRAALKEDEEAEIAAASLKPGAKKTVSHEITDEEVEKVLEAEGSGDFHPYQLLTHALLHGGPLHLAGNLLFLLVFGMRVNELIGNLKFAIVYPILAIGAGVAHMISTMNEAQFPMLGASGAIMGLAGMYFVFFPLQKVHMAAWWRLGLITGFKCAYKVFSMRGFWLLVLWIGLNDVLPVAIGFKGEVAHWAHLGGFMLGAAIALGLLVSRLVNANGNDILSVTLGKHAWALLGKPSQRNAALMAG